MLGDERGVDVARDQRDVVAAGVQAEQGVLEKREAVYLGRSCCACSG